jgi:ribonuclease BN (tRNA processing enzyme)
MKEGRMTKHRKDERPQGQESVEQDRRSFLKGSGVVAGGLAATAMAGASTANAAESPSENPYGARPGGGISLPDYYKPWPAIKNRNMYLPGTETLPKNEMRITFLGSSPWPPNRLQKGTSILVELGNGTAQPRRFFFDLGNGSVGNAIALQVPAALINDIFISHLHADHFADLPYMYPFRAFSGGFTPLRVYGPSGRTPELGTKHLVKHMKEMCRWHEENFDSCPIGDGFDIQVTEFDWKERNGICYDQDGVKVRHWPRSHVKDGASAYRLDWEEAGLSFVWTGDGRPDELSAEYGKGADVFVTEGTIDTPSLSAMKVGSPAELWEYTIDIYHTMYYAAGYLFKQAQPRMGAICHFEWSGDQLMAESVAQVRSHVPRRRPWTRAGSSSQVRSCPRKSSSPRRGCHARCSRSSSCGIWKSTPRSTIRPTPIASRCRHGPASLSTLARCSRPAGSTLTMGNLSQRQEACRRPAD